MSKFTFTSESVTEGHPDKVCDAISDAMVDSLLHEDKDSHIACETLATKNLVVVSGEVRSKGNIDVEKIQNLQSQYIPKIQYLTRAQTSMIGLLLYHNQ